MAELNDILTKQERLLSLEKKDFFEIDPKTADTWRNERTRAYEKHGKNAIYAIRTADDGKTYVIRTK